jgi:hypothetical protein
MSAPVQTGADSWRRRAAQVALLLGVAFGAAQLFDALPRDQELVFRIPAGQSVRALEATITDASGAELGGLTLRFPEGRRYSVRHPLNLANGDYEIRIEVELFQADGGTPPARPKTNLERRVTLRGGETPIVL